MIITYEQIAARAFEIWNEEGRPEGRDMEHWLRAERELREKGMMQQTGSNVASTDPAMLKTPKPKRGGQKKESKGPKDSAMSRAVI